MSSGTYWDLKGILSEIRSNYNCMDEEEEPYYRALSEAIRIVAQPEKRTEERAKTHACDSISRRAAIDAFSNNGSFFVYGADVCKAIVSRIKQLPAAEPEPKWIPCSERLPEDGKWCIFTDGANISVERYKFDALDHFFPPGRWFDLEDAVAWMPLPAPYREEVEQDDDNGTDRTVEKA